MLSKKNHAQLYENKTQMKNANKIVFVVKGKPENYLHFFFFSAQSSNNGDLLIKFKTLVPSFPLLLLCPIHLAKRLRRELKLLINVFNLRGIFWL